MGAYAESGLHISCDVPRDVSVPSREWYFWTVIAKRRCGSDPREHKRPFANFPGRMALLRVRELLRSVSGHAILRWARHWSSPGMAPYRAALRVLSCLVTDSRPARPFFSRVADLREGYKASPARPALPSGLLCCALSVPMAVMDPPSTLKPAQVAVAMVESGVLKHRTRADLVFFKAVRRSLLAATRARPAPDPAAGPRRRHAVLRRPPL